MLNEEFWKTLEEETNLAIPIYLKNLLDLNGYATMAGIRKLSEDVFLAIEVFVRSKLPKIVAPSSENATDYYYIFDKNVKDFEIVSGHRYLLLDLTELSEKIYQESKLPRYCPDIDQSALVAVNQWLMENKFKQTATKSNTTIECGKPVTSVNCVICDKRILIQTLETRRSGWIVSKYASHMKFCKNKPQVVNHEAVEADSLKHPVVYGDVNISSLLSQRHKAPTPQDESSELSDIASNESSTSWSVAATTDEENENNIFDEPNNIEVKSVKRKAKDNDIGPRYKHKKSAGGNHQSNRDKVEYDDACRVCDSLDHVSNECTTIKCYNCNNKGHIARKCPKKKSGCGKCGSIDHTFKVCPTIMCFNCHSNGHISHECPKEKVGCLKCGAIDHMFRDCTQEGDFLPYALCFACKEKGHISSQCPNHGHRR